MNHRSLFLAGVAGFSLGMTAKADQLFGVEYSATTPLYSVDQGTGALSQIGPSGQDNVGDLASDTRSGSIRVWGVRIAGGPGGELLEFNTTTGAATKVADINTTTRMTSLAFDPVGGKLYGNTSIGFGATADTLYEIDPANGNATAVGAINFPNVFALAFDQSGRLFGVSDDAKQLISINPTSGAGTLIAALAVSAAYDIASRPSDGTMFLEDSAGDKLYTVDTGNGALVEVGPFGGSFVNIAGLAFLPAVPEPSTVWAGGVTAAMLFGAAIRHRRVKAKA